jgi:hypothetical protein
MRYTVTTTNGNEHGVFLGNDLDYIKALVIRAGHTIIQIFKEDGTPY